jgi:hypothetical protein
VGRDCPEDADAHPSAGKQLGVRGGQNRRDGVVADSRGRERKAAVRECQGQQGREGRHGLAGRAGDSQGRGSELAVAAFCCLAVAGRSSNDVLRRAGR